MFKMQLNSSVNELSWIHHQNKGCETEGEASKPHCGPAPARHTQDAAIHPPDQGAPHLHQEQGWYQKITSSVILPKSISL